MGVGGIKQSESARSIDIDKILLGRLHLIRACAIGFLVKAFSWLGRALWALGTLVMSMNMMADAREILS